MERKRSILQIKECVHLSVLVLAQEGELAVLHIDIAVAAVGKLRILPADAGEGGDHVGHLIPLRLGDRRP